MTIPSRFSNDPKLANQSNQAADEQAAIETHSALTDQTPAVARLDGVDGLPPDLTAKEREQAAAALEFLSQVRGESKQSEQLPKEIGRYSIIRSIGRGGFAEVFLAEDLELDRRVALKVPLFNSASNDSVRQRFEREAKLAASLGHPQIVPVYEYGDLGAIRFIAFSWCDGPNLTDWIAENGPVEAETAASIVMHLADAVQHAHQRGVIHRDLKPGNILVDTSEDSAGKPVWERLRITDFGLARNFNNQDVTLTQDGQLVGTPAYMAPEQAGSGAEVGTAADVWALGMMLFELLTGQLPFRRPEILATIRAICDEPVPRSKKIQSDVSAELDAIVDLCLRKGPADRYESAHALATDLRRWKNGEPVIAKPESALSSFVKWTRRNPILAASISLTIASLAIGLGVALWQRSIAIANLREAQSQTLRADGNLETAQQLIGGIVELEAKLATESKLAAERTELVKSAAILQVKLVEDEKQSAKVRFDAAVTLRKLSNLLLRLGDHESSMDNAYNVLDLLEGLENEELSDQSRGMSPVSIYFMRIEQRMQIANVLAQVGKLDEADDMHVANEAERVPESASPETVAVLLAENLRGRALLLLRGDDNEAGAATLRRAITKFDGIVPSGDKRPAWNFHFTQCRLSSMLGTFEAELGNTDAAKNCFRNSLDCLESCKTVFPNHPMIPENEGLIAFQFGGIYETSKEWKAAIEQYELSRDIHLTLFEENPAMMNPANIYVLASLSLARSHKNNGALESSVEIANETIERASRFPEQLTETQSFKDNLGLLKALAK